jgi:hypothetical protein
MMISIQLEGNEIWKDKNEKLQHSGELKIIVELDYE